MSQRKRATATSKPVAAVPRAAPPKYPPMPGHPLTREVRLFHPDLPVSVNDLYVPIGRRQFRKSTEAKVWVNAFQASRGGLTIRDIASINLDPCRPYDLSIIAVTAADVWLTQQAAARYTGAPEDVYREGRFHPFRQIDVSNLFKLAEDAFKEFVGVDDRQNWNVHAYKRISSLPARQGLYIRLVCLESFDEVPAFEPTHAGWPCVLNDVE